MQLLCKKEEEVRKYIVFVSFEHFWKGREREEWWGGEERKKGRQGGRKRERKGKKEKGKEGKPEREGEREGNEGRINQKLILIILLIYRE